MKPTFHSLLIVLLFAPGAIAKTVQVGGCLPQLQTYPTISRAVLGVASGSTILVCPGTYPEQVTIGRPLTLRGVQSGNAANPTITVPTGATAGTDAFFQVLVQDTESGLVNISNITIDGSNAGNPDIWLVGIYYQNSSGTISKVSTIGQLANGDGFGVYLDNNATSTAKTISIVNSSIHGFDGEGIGGSSNPSLTVDIRSNSVVVTPSSTHQTGGIDVSSLHGPGNVSGNSVSVRPGISGRTGVGIGADSGMTISNNTVTGLKIGLFLGNSNTVSANRVVDSDLGIVVSGTNNNVEHNTLVNGGEAVKFNCTGTGNTVIHNTINEFALGITGDPDGNVLSPNSFSNVANLIAAPCVNRPL